MPCIYNHLKAVSCSCDASGPDMVIQAIKVYWSAVSGIAMQMKSLITNENILNKAD